MVLDVCNSSPLVTSNSLTVLSSDADASCLPSEEKTASRMSPEWPLSVCDDTPESCPIAKPCYDPHDASCLSSGDNTTAVASIESNMASKAPVAVSHGRLHNPLILTLAVCYPMRR